MKYCSHCGAQAEENANFCVACGNTTSSKKSSKKKIGIIAAVLIFLFAAGGLAYEFVLNKSPKYLYLQAELKNYERVVENWEEKYGQEWELQKALLEKPSRMITELSGNFAFQGLGGGLINQQLTVVQDALDQTKLSFTVEQDPLEEKYFTTASLFAGNVDLFSAEIYQSNEHTSLKLPVIYNKYFFFENEQFGQFMRRVDPYYVGPEKIMSLSNYGDSIDIPDKVKERLKLKYSQYVLTQLHEDMFTLDKVSHTTPDGEMKAREITFHMNEREVNDFLQGFIQEIKEDQELLDTITMKDGLGEIGQGLQELTFPEGLTVTAILDRKGNMIDRQVNLLVTDKFTKEAVQVGFTSNRFVNKQKEEEQGWKLEIEPTAPTGQDKGIIQVDQISKPEEKGIRTKTDGQMRILSSGREELNVSLELDTLRKPGERSNEQIVDTEFALSFGGAELEYTPLAQVSRIRGNIEQMMDQNLKKNYSKKDIAFDIYVDVNNSMIGKQSVGVKLQMNTDIEFTDTLFFPMMEGEEAVNVATMTEDEWWNTISQVESGFGNFIERIENTFRLF